MAYPPFRKRVEYVAQMEATECGAACLAMVLGFHGHHAGLPELRQACGVSRDGASALAILRAARAYGLEAEGVKVEVEDLAGLPCPAILHWGFDHFLVLERMARGAAFVVDPASGRRRAGRMELGRNLTGAALIFAPTGALRPRPRRRPSLAKYGETLREGLPGLTQVLLAALALQVAGLAAPVASQILLDRVILPRREAWLWGLAAALGAAAVMAPLLALVQGWVVRSLQARMDDALVTRFLDHLLHLPWSFFLQREAGDLLQRVHSNSALREFLGGGAARAVLDAALLAAFAALMLAYHPGLGLLVLGLGLAQAGLLALISGRNRQLMTTELAASGREAGALLEILSSFETTKASGGETRAVTRWSHRVAARVDASLERHRLALAFGAVMEFFRGGAAAAVFFCGGHEVLAHRMTVGVFVAFLALQGLFLAPLSALLGAVEGALLLGVHLGRLDDVLETAVEPSGTQDPGRLRGAISLRSVRFSHTPDGPAVLEGVDLDIRPGEKVALVGPTGAGKSTLARLLLGLHRPTAGTVAFDGRDLAELDLQALRGRMGVVLQETFLFDDTVKANLRQGDASIPMDRLRWAAAMACVEDVIEALPGGYDGRVGPNGSRLSGGQRQRLGLARALAREPAVLLLDEATSSLDLDTERRIHGNLAELGCTRVVIAHRLATVRDADRILVLKGGHIVQEGPFQDLQGREGPFRDLLAAAEPGSRA